MSYEPYYPPVVPDSVSITKKTLHELASTGSIDATYSILDEVSLQEIHDIALLLTTEYLEEGHVWFNSCPLIQILAALDELKVGEHSYLFKQRSNAETPMSVASIRGLIDTLPLNQSACEMFDPRCGIVVAAFHAAICDMLSIHDTTRMPILLAHSEGYIRQTQEVEQVNSEYYRLLRYTNIVRTTSRMARRIYLNQLNYIRTYSDSWGKVLYDLTISLGSRFAVVNIEHTEKYFADKGMYIYSPMVREGFEVAAEYYKNSNVDIFKKILEIYHPEA